MNYYLGAYHLLKLKPLDFGKFNGKKVLTGSRCLNESYFDAWSLSWTEDGMNNLFEPEAEFKITEFQIKELQKWSDLKFNEKRLGWINTFNDIETLVEYKTKFFTNYKDYEAIGIYFIESSIESIINEFEPKTEKSGAIGILDCIKQKIPEKLNEEVFVGYDLIGLEFSGDYHSFHCYDISDILINKFGLTLNEKGLINEFENKEEIIKYANNPDNGLPFGPWYLVKVKKVKNI